MKKLIPVLICACIFLMILLLQPLNLIGSERTRTTIHFGKTVPLTAIAEVAGGYRCYINDDEYFWVSAASSKQEIGEKLCVKFMIGHPTIIYRGEA